ncbi:MAG: hypothetical protein AVDCRST_MAG77-576, partial [uncultured Chloroflexi bacterium]
ALREPATARGRHPAPGRRAARRRAPRVRGARRGHRPLRPCGRQRAALARPCHAPVTPL